MERTPGFSCLHMRENFPEIWETVLFFCVLATCSDSVNDFSSALVLRVIYTGEEYSDWKPERNDHVVIVLLLLCNAAR